MVENIAISPEKELSLTLGMEDGKTIRPGDVVKSVFGLEPELIKNARIVKWGTGGKQANTCTAN